MLEYSLIDELHYIQKYYLLIVLLFLLFGGGILSFYSKGADKKNVSKILGIQSFVFACIIVFYISFRDIEVGIDTKNYNYSFLYVFSSFDTFNLLKESGFYLVNYIFS